MSTNEAIRIPLLIRGRLIEDHWASFGGRSGDVCFEAPDVSMHLDELVLRDPSAMADQYAFGINDVLDYIEELGQRLAFEHNPWMQQACEVSCLTSGVAEGHLRYIYARQLPGMFSRALSMEMIETSIGDVNTFDRWTSRRLLDGRIQSMRPFGARCVHINAGNAPLVAGICALRNLITRGDAIVKSPSNDPLTAYAIGRTMMEMAPNHPLTRHYSVAYWKGGDAAVEEPLYRNVNIEKIVAWGGFDSIKHVTRFLGAGLELVAMDPKHSCTIIGHEAFDSDDALQAVARGIAQDVGVLNQEGCANARVIFVQSGTDGAGVARLDRLGEYVREQLHKLPTFVSAPVRRFDPELRIEIEGIRGGDFYRVVGCNDNAGGVIVSHVPEPVDFEDRLGCRVCNLVPVDSLDEAIQRVNVYTQTIGIYPESLKLELRDRLALQGGQRIVSLGYHLDGSFAGAHDALEPLRRLCRWVLDETCALESYRSWRNEPGMRHP